MAKIVKDFNPYLVNAVKLSYRDGRMWCFDGQHTISAIKAMHKGRDCMVECKVFYGLTWLDEADLFVQQNGHSASVATREKLKTLFHMGNPDVCSMVRATEMVGLKVSFNASKSTNQIIAVGALLKAYKMLDTESFTDMLKIIKEAWGGAPESLVAEIISGMSVFYLTYNGTFGRKRLVQRLAKCSPVAIVRDGKVSQSGGMKRYARVILGIYNQNASTGRLEDRF